MLNAISSKATIKIAGEDNGHQTRSRDRAARYGDVDHGTDAHRRRRTKAPQLKTIAAPDGLVFFDATKIAVVRKSVAAKDRRFAKTVAAVLQRADAALPANSIPSPPRPRCRPVAISMIMSAWRPIGGPIPIRPMDCRGSSRTASWTPRPSARTPTSCGSTGCGATYMRCGWRMRSRTTRNTSGSLTRC